MRTLVKVVLSLTLATGFALHVWNKPVRAFAASSDGPTYTADKQLQFPTQYREWVYLTTGLDMTYTANATPPDHSVFGNVFVNPSSYREFLKTGAWPDGTTFVLENRGAVHGGEKQASINKHGLSQSEELMGFELHVKDATLPGGWGFFQDFDKQNKSKIVGRPASCYTCHEQHAAVDTTFVQFYPTLLGVATDKGTLSKAYLSEVAEPAH